MNNKPPEGFRLLGVGERVPLVCLGRPRHDDSQDWEPVSPWQGAIVDADDTWDYAALINPAEEPFATVGTPPGPLPWSAAERKRIPVTTGFLDYFPAAIAEVAKLSLAGNDQHNPGTPLHWDKSKSTDEADALLRHLMERGTFDTDGQRHSAKVAWRAMALLQRELEASHA